MFSALFNFGIIIRNINIVIIEQQAKVANNIVLLIVPYFPPQTPAKRLPMKLDKNQVPIINDKNFLGASFETSDKPIGDKQISPIVIIKYAETNHKGDTLEKPEKYPAKDNIMYDIDIKISANANLWTELGSFPFLFKNPQTADAIGANIIINNGLRDWKYPVGIVLPKITLFVEYSANNVNEEPACS